MKASNTTFLRVIKTTTNINYARELNFLPLEKFYSLDSLYNYKHPNSHILFCFPTPIPLTSSTPKSNQGNHS